ncbi:hypothetical protein D3C87_1999680 [compost metagenome]
MTALNLELQGVYNWLELFRVCSNTHPLLWYENLEKSQPVPGDHDPQEKKSYVSQ